MRMVDSTSSRKFRTEFHIHTNVSGDSFLGKRSLLFMCKIKRLDCVAITDHNELSNAIKWRGYFAKHGICVIPGEEIMSSEGEIIGLFLQDRVAPGMTPEETVADIRRQGGIVYLPHPYDAKRHKSVLKKEAIMRLSDSFDCAEEHNGRNEKPLYSNQQKFLVEELGMTPIVGSDAHAVFEIGRNVCISPRCFTRENFLATLKESYFEKRECLKAAHSWTKYVRFLKMVRKGDFDSIRRIIYGKPAR